MKLVLAEKPSVAQSIAKVLGAAKREDGYLEGNGYVVSWCVGHLVELAQPEVYDAKYSKWAYADLPIFPMDWQYEVSAGTKKQFGILKKLMAREDVASLVCATDAGREGELIFRLVYHKAGCRKPFERLWISSMEDVAIKEGFENLRSGTEYDALYEAALCRERADWIVGINATRLFSTLYGQTLNVGRVMTPTLAMAVMREAAISAFKPELFYTVQIGLDGFTAASERFKTKAAAEAVKQSCSVAIVQKAECKEKTEKPPALYDLTSLQREANRVLGYTAQQTLDYTQNLYEKKLVTYPRTDSRFLTEDMAHSLTDLVKLAFHTFPVEDVDNIPVHAEQVVNNKKVTDHHAIIPTRELQKCNLSELPKGELAILQLISNRLCVAVGDPHRYAETVIELDCGGTVFSTKGKTVVQDGWKALVQKNDSTKSDENVQTLPSVSVGDEMTVSGTEIKEGKTSPPKHFTEDTLLSAMETAGADEMPDEVERKGLGTPATRAGIIEKLVRIGFLERKLGFSIHNYFFAKALDQVRPGGVVAFVTSRYTMDSKNSDARRYMAQRAELLGAIRLPNDAFKKNAGTEVVSDILFLQKRDHPIDIVPEWVNLDRTEEGHTMNSYFVAHPEMVLGDTVEESTAYGMDITVRPIEGMELSELLKEAVSHIQGTYQAVELPEADKGKEIETIPATPDVKNFSYTVVDGNVYFRENSLMRRVDLNEKAKDRVMGMVELRGIVNELIEYQLEDYPDEMITQKQAELNDAYDAFAAKNGLINNRANGQA